MNARPEVYVMRPDPYRDSLWAEGGLSSAALERRTVSNLVCTVGTSTRLADMGRSLTP